MGALSEGFEDARQKHAAQLAENRAREQVIEDHLRGLEKILEEDAAFLSEHDIALAIKARTMHVDQRRSPMITVHFDPAEGKYQLTFMKNGSHLICATPDEVAKAIGGHFYELQRLK